MFRRSPGGPSGGGKRPVKSFRRCCFSILCDRGRGVNRPAASSASQARLARSHALESGAWRTFRDAGALVRQGGIDWPGFVALARRTRAASCCYWTLRLAARVGALRVPDDALRGLRPPLPGILAARLERHYLGCLWPLGRFCPSVRVQNLSWELGIRPRWSGHGATRPWSRDVLFEYIPESATPVTAAAVDAPGLAPPGFPGWVGRLAELGRYARAMLAP